jgi:hypothetical protein
MTNVRVGDRVKCHAFGGMQRGVVVSQHDGRSVVELYAGTCIRLATERLALDADLAALPAFANGWGEIEGD